MTGSTLRAHFIAAVISVLLMGCGGVIYGCYRARVDQNLQDKRAIQTELQMNKLAHAAQLKRWKVFPNLKNPEKILIEIFFNVEARVAVKVDGFTTEVLQKKICTSLESPHQNVSLKSSVIFKLDIEKTMSAYPVAVEVKIIVMNTDNDGIISYSTQNHPWKSGDVILELPEPSVKFE